MKKTYMQPESACIDIVSEGMIAASTPSGNITIDPDGSTNESGSNHMGGWNSSNWADN
ncbi:hypothetical protein IMSAGC014_00660 [Bacteroidaceae bacterium]|uniref:hypothetical protein n=1 Tax=Prevotella sp. MGM2 TaxID=2033406 RepID=UPI000D0C1BFC|nr:hypothetical protein [Prevotella sp. MGM2]GAY29785.1 hypothetical protein PvtlMGM2_0638 [Prevotella sp. MGM2]GFI34171.1 hypothetical protein IMSAGC014_00660 [Bacteroidaceae bacterium]